MMLEKPFFYQLRKKMAVADPMAYQLIKKTIFSQLIKKHVYC